MNKIMNFFYSLNNVLICIAIPVYLLAVYLTPTEYKTTAMVGLPVVFFALGYFIKSLDFNDEGLPSTLAFMHLPLLPIGFVYPVAVEVIVYSALTMYILAKIGLVKYCFNKVFG